MNRRRFLQLTGVAAAAMSWPQRRARAGQNDGWREHTITTRVVVLSPKGPTRVWIPLPLAEDSDYQQTRKNEWHAPVGKAALFRDDHYGVTMVSAEWPEGATPVLLVTSVVATRDRAVDLAARGGTQALAPALRALYTAPTRLIPTDGIVAETARKIVTGVPAEAPIARAHAVYEWIVENTFRDPKVKGCGVGDIKALLDSQNLGGKCADLNALFVGLLRSLGIPARDVYGIRVAESQRGTHSLGKSGDITHAQHCRAEFFADGFGWIPVDPADVRKLVLEEPPGNLALDDPRVKTLRARAFGDWEMNWIAYNTGHDVALPGSTHPPLGFLLYPQAETADGRVDCLDALKFEYQIDSRES